MAQGLTPETCVIQDCITASSCRKHYTAILGELQGHSVDTALLKLPDPSGWSFAEAEELPEVCQSASTASRMSQNQIAARMYVHQPQPTHTTPSGLPKCGP